jgi:ribulose-5-phosphate 4-epimerase/fuculose-1-phosphate aldolase
MSEKEKIIKAISYFKDKGWMPGARGALALLNKISDESHKIYITANTPQKGYLTNNDIFVLRNLYGENDIVNPLNQSDEALEISKWASIFIEIFSRKPEAKCIVQYCPKWPVLAARMAFASWRAKAESYPNLLRLSHWGLLDGLGSTNELLVPIVNYGDAESMLSSIRRALSLHPEICALLIRDYGVILWGETLQTIKNKTEIFNHVCELEVFDFYLNKTINKALL